MTTCTCDRACNCLDADWLFPGGNAIRMTVREWFTEERRREIEDDWARDARFDAERGEDES